MTLLGWTDEQWRRVFDWAYARGLPVPVPFFPKVEVWGGIEIAQGDLAPWRRLQSAWLKAHDYRTVAP